MNQLDICNSALINLGSMPINALADGSKEGKLLQARWNGARDYVLREHPWKCAIKRVNLSPTNVEPLRDCHTLRHFQYAFNFPSDYLRLALNDDDQLHYQIEGRQFLSNEQNPMIRYVWQVSDPTLLDAHLAETLAWYLAAMIAMSLVQNTAVVDRMMKGYMQFLSKAKFIDAATSRAVTQKEDYFESARLNPSHL